MKYALIISQPAILHSPLTGKLIIQTIFGANINCLILGMIFLPTEINKTTTFIDFYKYAFFPFMAVKELPPCLSSFSK